MAPALSQQAHSTLPRPSITMCLPVLSHLFLSVCVCAIYVWSRSSFQVRRFTFLSADVDKTIDLVAYWRLTFTDCNKTHFCCQFWLHSLYSWWFGWFSQLFQWILHWSSRFGPGGWEKQNKQQLYASLHHTDAVWSRMKVEQDKSFSTAALWFIQTEKNGSGSYLAVSTHSLGPVYLRRGSGGTSSMRHVRLLVWLSVHGFACRSCLARASTCFWTQCTEYPHQVTQSAQFQPYLVLATLFFTGTRETFTGKKWHMLV